MKRNPYILTFIFLFFFALILNASISTADVWLSPMKLHVSGMLNTNESVFIERTIYLKNDDNTSAIVTFDVLNNSVIFDNNTIILGPFEELYIHPMVIVREGFHTDSIIVSSSPFNSSTLKNQTGSQVTTSMLIRVTSEGILSNNETNIQKDNTTENSNIYLFLILCIIIIGFVVYKILIKKKINK